MKLITIILCWLIVLLTVSATIASRRSSPAGGGNYDYGAGGSFGPGGGFDMPGFGSDIGGGYGGPNGWYSRGGVVRTTVVCKDRGPCYQKKVTCPARCFYYFSHSGRGNGGGGGGSGCTIDCKNKCTAYC